MGRSAPPSDDVVNVMDDGSTSSAGATSGVVEPSGGGRRVPSPPVRPGSNQVGSALSSIV